MGTNIRLSHGHIILDLNLSTENRENVTPELIYYFGRNLSSFVDEQMFNAKPLCTKCWALKTKKTSKAIKNVIRKVSRINWKIKCLNVCSLLYRWKWFCENVKKLLMKRRKFENNNNLSFQTIILHQSHIEQKYNRKDVESLSETLPAISFPGLKGHRACCLLCAVVKNQPASFTNIP